MGQGSDALVERNTGISGASFCSPQAAGEGEAVHIPLLTLTPSGLCLIEDATEALG